MYKSLILAILLFFGASASTTKAQRADDLARLLRFPDIHGDLIAFVYAGDIWTVPASGGTARRLTSHPGLELFPKISPDGRWIAFSAEYNGTRQVFVISVDGGEPRQLTYRNDVGALPPRGGWDNRVLGWTPDGKNVLFRANRVPYSDRLGHPYLVAVEGGAEQPLQINQTGGMSYSPDGTKVAFTPISNEFRGWKRYRGGQSPDVWIYDLTHNTSEQITNTRAQDMIPVWLGDTIYYLSDRDWTMNVYAYDTRTKKTRKVTNHSDYDVLWPSGSGVELVYEAGGYIYRLDTRSSKEERVPIKVYGDFPDTVPYFKNVRSSINSFSLSPSGARALFEARGDVFTAPAKEGEVRNLTSSQGVREIAPAWSPDGRMVAYLSDRSGEYEIYVRQSDGTGEERRVTNDGDIWRFPVAWSPDSTMLAYGDKKQRLRYVNVVTGKTTDVDHSSNNDITNYTWAPDSRWLAYTKNGDNQFSEIWVYSVTNGRAQRLTGGQTSDTQPVFDPKGRYLYFLSNRDFNLTFSGFEFNYIYTNPTRIYVGMLVADGPALFLPGSDEERVKTKETPLTMPPNPAQPSPTQSAKGQAQPAQTPEQPAPTATPAIEPKVEDKKPASQANVKIDFENFENRVRAIPGPPNNYRNLTATPDGVLYLSGPGRLSLYNLTAKAEQTIMDGIRDYDLSPDGKQIIFQVGENFGVAPVAPGQKPDTGLLKLDGMTMKIEPKAEWAEEYTDAWRIMRDWFYDPNMHGMDWRAIRTKYEQLVPYIANREDLNFVLTEMGSELMAGHIYVERGSDTPRVTRTDGGLLGAEIVPDASGYFKITKIFPGENWHESFRSPLTEPGVKAKVGDYILAVDGRSVRGVKNFYELLEGKGDRAVALKLSDRPDAAGSHDERVRPVKNESNLRYLDWVESQQALVEKLSGGRIGYIHVPNTAVEGNRELFKNFYPQTKKDALIIDDRYNGGGFIPDRMIELLERKPLNYWTRRGVNMTSTPAFSHLGPKAMLINGYAGSGGDALPFYFRERGLGRIFGTPTWGGLIGLSGNPQLEDGGSLSTPSFRFLDLDGKWAVEGVGVDPDTEVVDTPDALARGEDPTLEAAVKYLLEELRRNPPKRPTPPPPPVLRQ
ncbi:MAG TPA: PDZ domain-containing protein [Pyrinomonadaceae bacterium]|jgi:tricorn protease|nr:PDZ domain-containing protein [Pyrinomonadaceae bacterium]